MFDIMAQYQRLRVLQNIKIMVTGFLLFDRIEDWWVQAPSGSRIIAYRHPKHMQQYGDMAIDLQLSTAMDVWLNHRIIKGSTLRRRTGATISAGRPRTVRSAGF